VSALKKVIGGTLAIIRNSAEKSLKALALKSLEHIFNRCLQIGYTGAS